jgi:hypothetical protein
MLKVWTVILKFAKSLGDQSVSHDSRTHHQYKIFPFSSFKAKTQRCLKYIDCNYLEIKNQVIIRYKYFIEILRDLEAKTD